MTAHASRQSAAEGSVFVTLLAVLAFAPLPFGADRPWAWSLVAMVVGVLLLVWGVFAALSRAHQPASLRPVLPAVVLFLMVVVWAALQTVPLFSAAWPAGIWAEAGSALGIRLAAPVSLDPDRTWTALMRLLAYGGVFLLTFQLCMSSSRSERLIRVLIVIALAYAGYGLFVTAAGLDTILWYRKHDPDNLSSTFIYRNAYATYAALGLMCALAMLFRPAMRRDDLAVGWRFAARALGDYFFARKWILMLASAVLFVAIILTRSRAGLGVSVVGGFVFVMIMAWTRRRKRYVMAAVAAMGIAAVALLALGAGPTVQRMVLVQDAAAERGEVYLRTIEAITRAPATGVGYGTYANVFAMYRGEDLESPFLRAHNTYVENALELGVPALAALVLAVGWIVVICVSAVLRHRRRAFLPCLGISASVLVGLHATVDYSLQIPAVAMTFAAILGAACAQSFRLEIPERPEVERRAM